MAGGQRIAGAGDTIILQLPHGHDLLAVALLVVAGLGVRLNLTIESLEDLELAVESLLGRVPGGEETTLEVRIGEGKLTASVSPVDGARVRAELDEESSGVGLRRLLQTVADRVEVVDRDGASWLQIEKQVSGERQASAE